MRERHLIALFLASALAAGTGVASAQPANSKEAAKALTTLLDQRQLDAIAARDSERPDGFVAALYYPGAQLLVVTGTYAAPAVLDQKIASGQFKDVYAEIGSTMPATGRYFVMDLGGDGLRDTRARNEPFDIVYRNGAEQISYNGDWKHQDISESEYQQRFADDEAEYVRALALLAASLSGARSAPGDGR
jgi:hypothetical protein